MKVKKIAHLINMRLISTGFFVITTSWFVVDNFIIPISFGKYILIEIIMGIVGAIYEFEKGRLKKNNVFDSDKSKNNFN